MKAVDLIIVRHAIAPEKNAGRWPDDRLRPLSARGASRGRKAAAGLARLTAKPEVVLTSPLLRTRQTAKILERQADWPVAQPCADLAPEAQPRSLLARLRRTGGTRIAVVGHEPHLSALLRECLPGDTQGISFRKMGVALVRFHGRPRAGRGQLLWIVPPKLLRAARDA